MKKWASESYQAFLFFIGVLIIWQLAPIFLSIKAYILPTPMQIFYAFWEEKNTLCLVHLPITLSESIVGFAISVVLGFLIAGMMHFSYHFEKTIYPWIIISQTVPIIVLSPLVIMLLGYGFWSKVFIIFLISFFPVSINVFQGLKTADQGLISLLQSYGATKNQIFWKVEVPHTIPFILSGTKMAAVISVVGATLGEWLGSNSGLGYYSKRMTANLNADSAFAAVLLLALLGLLLHGSVKLIEIIFLKKYLHNER